jgi:hypothetical protein
MRQAFLDQRLLQDIPPTLHLQALASAGPSWIGNS